eukprot:SAG11_NODE_133_length_15400_cov_10.132344_9_plen_169_part_00
MWRKEEGMANENQNDSRHDDRTCLGIQRAKNSRRLRLCDAPTTWLFGGAWPRTRSADFDLISLAPHIRRIYVPMTWVDSARRVPPPCTPPLVLHPWYWYFFGTFLLIPGGRDLIFSGKSLTRQRDGGQGYATGQTCGIALPPGFRAAHRGLSAPSNRVGFSPVASTGS